MRRHIVKRDEECLIQTESVPPTNHLALFSSSSPPCVSLLLFFLPPSSPLFVCLSFLFPPHMKKNKKTFKYLSLPHIWTESVPRARVTPFFTKYCFHSFSPPSFSFHAELFSEVMNAVIWRGRGFHPEFLAAGPSMKASVCTSSMAFPLGHC